MLRITGVGERGDERAVPLELPLERVVGDGEPVGVVLRAGDVVAGDDAADALVGLDRPRRRSSIAVPTRSS